MSKFNYSHRRWRRLRAAFLAEHPLCKMCGDRGRVTAATVVDHKKAISAGGDPWDWDNLQSLCVTDHNAAKRSQEATGHLRGCDVDGNPLNPEHHWNREASEGGRQYPKGGGDG
jgi:5-methylcytosine-specific restriction endonuclease McrA